MLEAELASKVQSSMVAEEAARRHTPPPYPPVFPMNAQWVMVTETSWPKTAATFDSKRQLLMVRLPPKDWIPSTACVSVSPSTLTAVDGLPPATKTNFPLFSQSMMQAAGLPLAERSVICLPVRFRFLLPAPM